MSSGSLLSHQNKSIGRFLLSFLFLSVSWVFAQQTYNLEIVFKKTRDPAATTEGFGLALSTAGDVNTDGFDDIIIGSPSGMIDGRCYLYYGGNPMDTISDMTFWGDTAGDGFAVSMCSGDLNGDSISDIIIGLQNGWVNYAQPGKVYIYFGGAGLDNIPDLVINGHNNSASFGAAVACGDINGDSYQDLVVGEVYYPNSFVCNGRVYVYYGGPLLDTIPDIIINGHNGECFGYSVGSGGDLNSDGFEDILVGAYENSESYGSAGKVYAFFGGNPMDTIPDCWLHGEAGGDRLGWFGCDIMKNSTGYDRMITSTMTGGTYFTGKVYILFGGNPMDTLPDIWMIGKNDTSALGEWCSSAGNVDAGSDEEALAGAVNDIGNGCGYSWLGNLPMDSIEDAYLRGNIHYYGIGWMVASAGDVNGDGYDEVMFSNYAADSNKSVWVCRYTGPGIVEQRARGIEQIMQVYPNPFSDHIRCRIQDTRYRIKDFCIKIYDIAGRKVMKYDINNSEGETVIDTDTRHLPAGVYFVQVEMEGIKKVQKVIKIE
jgi:hypothetical protein